MPEIPKQFANPAFRFILIHPKSKLPIEIDWQNTKNYSFEEMQKKLEKTNYNYGIIGGYGKLAGVDADAFEIQQAIEKNLPKTFKVRSGGQSEDREHPDKFHYYFVLDEELQKTIPLFNPNNSKENWGHVRWKGGQLVGANSIHETGRAYEIVENIPIAKITKEELLSVLSPFTKRENVLEETPKEFEKKFETLKVEQIVSLTSLTNKGNGKFQGGHPFHDSTTKWNFEVDTKKNVFYCFQHEKGGSAFELIAIEAGLLDCGDCGKGALKDKEKFKKVLKIAQEKYGLKKIVQTKKNLNETEEQPLNFLTSRELLNTPKEKSFVVQHLIQKNTVNQLLSPPAQFKSILAMYLAVCVANGLPFLGFQTKKHNVAYLDKENNRQLLRDRLQKILAGLKIRKKLFPVCFLLKEGMLDDESFVQRLSEYVEENKIGFLVFDTLVRFNSGEENSAKDMNKIYQSFVKLQQTTGAAILFLHHTNRQGEFRGSSDLMGQVDTMYSIEREKNTNSFTIENTKNRIGEINPINAEIVFGEETITISVNDEAIEAIEEEKQDKFQIARAFIFDFATNEAKNSLKTGKNALNPSKNAAFDRSDLIIALKAWNEVQNKEKKVSPRLIDGVLKHLCRIKFLKKGDKQGEYYMNNTDIAKINRWISIIGEGNALNPVPLQTKKEELTT